MRRAFLAAAFATAACGSGAVPSPFVDAGRDAAPSDGAGDAADAAPTADAKPDADPNLGGPCVDDAQCDDEVDCTFDACDPAAHRCRSTPDDSRCLDSVYCDGLERCDPKLGCREGDPIACSDDTVCTIDTCIEATLTCDHVPRDADGDGDPTWNCTGGGDCNDADPTISSKSAEVCGNAKDDDCDGEADETTGCVQPEHDTCLDALEVTASGTYSLSLVAAKQDYPVSCIGGGPSWREVVVALEVPPGAPQDVDVRATAASGTQLGLAGVEPCGSTGSEFGCRSGTTSANGSAVARLVLRSLPPGNHALYVIGTGDAPVALDVTFGPATAKPAHETCGTAKPLAAEVHELVTIVDATADLASECSTSLGDLVYSFTLDAAYDVDLHAVSIDGVGEPLLSLRDPDCVAPGDEITCRVTDPAHVFARALGPGTYYVGVSATAPSDLDLRLSLGPPTAAPPDETCAGAPLLVANAALDVTLDAHTDDAKLGCAVGAVDAAYRLDLGVRSDVLLTMRISSQDTGYVSLARAPCAASADELGCATSNRSPVRVAQHDLAPGSYRAVLETEYGNPVQLTPLVRAAVPPALVAFSDTCATAVTIPPTGGFFIGNTANASADYAATCDLGGQAAGGAPEQVLRLDLPARQRVVFDMKGSGYNTLLAVRRGPDCPGVDVLQGCAAGYVTDRSYLDLTLDAGSYWVQVDGYAGDSGAWMMDVFVVP